MKSLMSAAHAAGYAMAAEEVAESRAESGVREQGTVVAVRARPPMESAHKYLRRMWLRAWFADHWPGRATA
jgi:ATP sulfurylase